MLDDLILSSGYNGTSTAERGGGGDRDRGREKGVGGLGGKSILTSAAGISGRSRRSSLEPLYESSLSSEVSPLIDYDVLDLKKKLKKKRSVTAKVQ